MTETDTLLTQLQRLARKSEREYFRALDPAFARVAHGVSGDKEPDARNPLNRLLVAVDFSDCSRAALSYAIRLGELAGCDAMILVHILSNEKMRESIRQRYPFQPRDTQGPIQLDDSELVEVLAEEREKSYAALQCFVPAASALRRVQLRVLIGDPLARILDAAAETRADTLVLGTHGRTGLQRVVMGSVAERVVRAAPCPVITVKEA